MVRTKPKAVVPPEQHMLPFQGGAPESRHGVRASPDKNRREGGESVSRNHWYLI